MTFLHAVNVSYYKHIGSAPCCTTAVDVFTLWKTLQEHFPITSHDGLRLILIRIVKNVITFPNLSHQSRIVLQRMGLNLISDYMCSNQNVKKRFNLF